MLHAVIMAGGAGTRFWPESRAALPKQLLPLAGERTMLQMAVDRLQPIESNQQSAVGESAFNANRTWILTNDALVPAVRKQLPFVPHEQIIGEPCKRDTAPCIGLAALLLLQCDPDATMLVMPADQVIQPAEEFQGALLAAAALVEESPQRIVTFGIKPTYAATTFGYIERGDKLALAADIPAASELGIYQVAKFREKPPAEVAKEYVASGKFYWNSGIFIWKAATIAKALQENQPEMFARLSAITKAWLSSQHKVVFPQEFAAIKGISIDYAVMEHANDIAVIEAPFAWDDVGTWQAVARLLGSDAHGNTEVGKHITIDSRDCILRSNGEHLIVAAGVRDLIIVHTPDATLVANRSDEESVRKVVKILEERGWREYL